MSEHTEIIPPDRDGDTAAPPPQAPEPPRRGPTPWLYGLGFLILAGGIYAAWEYPRKTESPDLKAVQQRLADFDSRLTRLEQRPAAVASVSEADLSKLAARIDALDAKVSDQAKIADQTKAADQTKTADQTELNGRVDAVSGRIESLSGRIQSGLDGLGQQIQTGLDALRQQTDHLAARVATLEKVSGGFDTVSDHLARLARIQEAGLALTAGRPVGDIPGAPAALARFAHTAPPTETQLRQLFVQAEHAAIAAKQPDNTAVPLVDRIWERAQGLVTVHRGEDVVVGNPAAVTLGQARAALDAGDLKGAISTVEQLKGQPRDAMANWLAEARSLVDARAALTDLAGQS